MGFYGNIPNTSRTTFAFDKVYSHYYGLQDAAETDGIFLGRYILIDYDDPPIEGYYSENKFYTTDAHIPGSEIPGEAGYIYKDLHTALNNSGIIFYTFNTVSQEFEAREDVSDLTNYAQNYHLDITEHGRGYDNTVWMKQFDIETEKYKYINIANLNSVIPDLSLIIDAPQPVGLTPYFDASSTNLNYYLHMTPQYGFRIGAVDDSTASDETISYTTASWARDASGIAYPQYTVNSNTRGDIYYNKAGFNKAVRNLSSEENIINVEIGKSGLTYPLNDNIWDNNNLQSNDTYDLKIRLPIIGNAVSEIWDSIYGVDNNGNRCYTESDVPSALTASDALNFYVNDDGHFLVSKIPVYTQDNDGDFYKFDDNTYHIINPSVNQDSNKRYSKSIGYAAVNLEEADMSSINGAIRSVLNLLGTADPDRRDYDTAQGTINIMKDLISNIDTQLAPNKLICTNSDGQITTSSTVFPYNNNNQDASTVLAGDGTWVSRFGVVSVTGSFEGDSYPISSDGDIVSSKTMQGKILLAPGNRWIKLNADLNATRLRISHKTISGEDSTSTANLVNHGTFKAPTIQRDAAGHVTVLDVKTNQLPWFYDTIQLENTNTKIQALTSGALTIKTDNWLTLTAGSGQEFTISHNTQNAITGEKKITESSVAFGGTFTIPDFTLDNQGHMVGYSTHTITVREPSLTQTENKNIVTSVALSNAANGQFSITRENLGDIVLASFTLDTTATGSITASDTLTTALSRIVNNLNSVGISQEVMDEIDNKIDAVSNALIEAQESWADDLEELAASIVPELLWGEF